MSIVPRPTTKRGPNGRKIVRYGVRVNRGGGYEWVGTFDTRDEARKAEFDALSGKKLKRAPLTVGELADLYMEDYRRTRKPQSVRTAEQAFVGLKRDLGKRKPATITRTEAARWAADNRWRIGPTVAMMNWAVEHDLIADNPFKGLYRRTPGRRDHDPLTEDQVQRLAQFAGRVHAPLQSLVVFAAYTGLRVGECLALEWDQVDFERNRIDLRRLKSGRRDPAALTPPAKQALLALPRFGGHIFRGKQGGPLSYSNLGSTLWPQVQILFGEFNGENVDFHELRHFAAHHFYVRMGLPSRVVATQLGHTSPALVEQLYGHWRVGALDEIDAAFAQAPALKVVGG